MVNLHEIQLTVEKMFRQRWMDNNDWLSFENYLCSKGFTYDHVAENLPDEVQNQSTRVKDFIYDYIYTLL